MTLEPPQGLDDRLYNLLKSKPLWSFHDAREVIPAEQATDITIYKAISRLEAQRRIRYMATTNRRKYYTHRGVSNLPVFRTRDGKDLTLKNLMLAIQEKGFYVGDYWGGSDRIKDLPIVLVNLFLVAQKEDRELTYHWASVVKELRDIQTELTTMLEYIETILKHPTMSGDLKHFKKVYTNNEDPDAPTMEELNEFKRWLTKHRSISTNGGTAS